MISCCVTSTSYWWNGKEEDYKIVNGGLMKKNTFFTYSLKKLWCFLLYRGVLRFFGITFALCFSSTAIQTTPTKVWWHYKFSYLRRRQSTTTTPYSSSSLFFLFIIYLYYHHIILHLFFLLCLLLCFHRSQSYLRWPSPVMIRSTLHEAIWSYVSFSYFQALN